MNILKIFQYKTENLLPVLDNILRNYGYNTYKHRLFLYAEGNIPIMLMAHIDTVFPRPPQNIFFDRKKQILWSPEGLGADDRAGVYGIIKILENGYRPYILFTDMEEYGGKGAITAAKKLYPCVNYIIELDRAGENDAVFYDCDNKEFENYINSFGFKTSWGLYSDISFTCPKWGVAGVNLSIGYFMQHTKTEYLNINIMKKTLGKICKMLEDNNSRFFKYIKQNKKVNNKINYDKLKLLLI